MLVGSFLVLSATGTDRVASSNPVNSPYSQWSNGPSSDPHFFPIGVWLQSPRNVREFEKIGINLFVGYSGQLNQTSLSEMASAHMGLVPEQDLVGLSSPGNRWIKGWDSYDEPDNAQPNGKGGYGPCIAPSKVIASYHAIRAKDPTRPVLLNFGRGVSVVQYRGRGACTGDTSYYPRTAQGGDIISFDIYPVAEYGGKLELIAAGLDNLRRWTGGRKVIWNFVEASPFDGGAVPTPAQERAEVWMSLIHGSRGILYFVHQFKPHFREDGIFNYPSLVHAVARINAQIISLAPVLNSPTVRGDVTAASSASAVPVDLAEKRYEGSTYVFAVAMRNASTTATFTTPGVRSGMVSVIGEGRQLSSCDGQFKDRFAGYAVHLYRFSRSASAAAPCKSAEPLTRKMQ